jgi:uncharacterized protein YbgA (DUF1722 family)/uncharacterized protein YbbK (DUF523 family)
MAAFEKPNIVVSKCLGFDACRYNGQMLKSHIVEQLKPYARFMPVCAEVEIGLGVPRFPIRLVSKDKEVRLMQPETGRDVSRRMGRFCSDFFSGLKDIDGMILKSRSPSCGIKDVRIYHGIDKAGTAGKGAGFFGKAAIEHFPNTAIEDEGRLTNFRIREHFFSRIFQSAKLRKVLRKGKISGLIDFHANNKFLLMAANQSQLKRLGRIAANTEARPFDELGAEYAEGFGKCLRQVPRSSSIGNMLLHIFGFFKGKLGAREKRFFLESLDMYKEGRIPLSSAVNILKAWAIRENEEYLLSQTIFNPFPEELIELTFSGKPIEM